MKNLLKLQKLQIFIITNISKSISVTFGRIGRHLVALPEPDVSKLISVCQFAITFLLIGVAGVAQMSKQTSTTRVARFFLVQNTKTGKIYQITTNYTKCP
jgi:hypothetical protein